MQIYGSPDDCSIEGVADLALTLDVDMVLTVGALQVDVPHTRPVPVTGSTGNVQLASRLGLSRSTYEGPTGIVGVFQDACLRLDIPGYDRVMPAWHAAIRELVLASDLEGVHATVET